MLSAELSLCAGCCKMLLTFCTFSGPIKGPNNLRLWLSFRAEKRRQAAASGGGAGWRDACRGAEADGGRGFVVVVLWLLLETRPKIDDNVC